MDFGIIKEIIIGCVIQAIKEDQDHSQYEIENIDGTTKLLGKNGVLDSHGLVSAIVGIEEIINDEHNISIVIADERAMSQTNSPFISIETLCLYIEKLIKEQMPNG